MRILFTSLAPPFPPTNGHRIRNWGLLCALAQEGHEITLLSFADREEMEAVPKDLSKLCKEVELIPMPRVPFPRWISYWNRMLALASPLPYGAQRLRSAAFQAAMKRRLNRETCDVVLCDDVYLSTNLPPTDVPILLNKHDLTHMIMKRYLSFELNPLKLLYGWLEYWKVRRLEIETCAALDGVLTVSESDQNCLRKICPLVNSSVAPNVIDTESYPPVHSDDGKTVLYTGSMDWYPNQDAVRFFVATSFPLIRKLDAGVRFVVAGRGAPEALKRSLSSIPGVRFTGWVPDMRAEIARATVCVVPLRVGSGTRLKILEAAAMCKAVVSTRLGAEGLDLIHGKEIIIADEPVQFAKEVQNLIIDRSRRSALGAAARDRVAKQYSLPALRTALRNALARLNDNVGPRM